ncbi:MAG: hypothetical protein PVG85_02885 [Deltaproteobacteria bacterium]
MAVILNRVCETLTTTLTGPVLLRCFLLLLGVLFLAVSMRFHHLGLPKGRVMMFMVWFMAVGHAFMAVGMIMEKLKLLVLAGMLPT